MQAIVVRGRFRLACLRKGISRNRGNFKLFNIINLMAPSYLRTNVDRVHHRYTTRASNLACVKGSGQTSFFYSSICHWNKLPTEIRECKVKNSFRKKGNDPIIQQIDG